MTNAITEMRTLARGAFDDLLDAAAARKFLPRHLPAPPISGRVILLAGGKAAASMVEAAESHYLDTLGLPPERLTGVAVTCYAHGRRTRRIPVIQSGYPRPDLFGVAGTERMLALADSAGFDDLVVVMLSAGAEANLVAPARGLSLMDKQRIGDELLRAGASRADMTRALGPMSAIKSGGLALRAAPAEVVTIVLPDGTGDAMAEVGGAPSVPLRITRQDSRAVLERYRVTPTGAAEALFGGDHDDGLSGVDKLRVSPLRIGLDAADLLSVAGRRLMQNGYDVRDLGLSPASDARHVALAHATLALEARAANRKTAILSCGRLLTASSRPGETGPNLEYALMLANTLRGATGIVALSAGTDGTDGGVGQPTDACGALIDPVTLQRMEQAGVDAGRHLDNNRSAHAFRASGDCIVTGPTCTHANDVRLILVNPALD
ncbi:MAG: DUF4147 domain-containing protein [Proteobacteria bacterium]|nr:DUF4147 domain-containing protein [Pseudomonadota bacterium]